mmetsp:Transcript_39783/g.114042  ORF Transcript_39783/g.114042 Transcript_39783/m.114042 type:complete len:291 (+) Transcript_39783:88-960(+)
MRRRRRNRGPHLDKCLVQGEEVGRRNPVIEQLLNKLRARSRRIRIFVVQHDQGLILALQVVGSTPLSVLTCAKCDPHRSWIIALFQLREDLFPLTRIGLVVDSLHDPIQQFVVEHEVVPSRGIHAVLVDLAAALDERSQHHFVHKRALGNAINSEAAQADAFATGAPILLLAQLFGAVELADGAIVERSDPARHETLDSLAILCVDYVAVQAHFGFNLHVAPCPREVDDGIGHGEVSKPIQNLLLRRIDCVGVRRVEGEDGRGHVGAMVVRVGVGLAGLRQVPCNIASHT